MKQKVSIVVCTRNRRELAMRRAEWALAQDTCAEAIFVVDGATDDTVPALRDLATTDKRLRVLALPSNRGVPAAKNIGTRAATAEWVLLLDDDDQLSSHFLTILLETAEAAEADIVGVPWLHLRPGESLDAAVARTPRVPGGPALDHPSTFPVGDWQECYWLPSNGLYRRTVFDSVHFDERYGGNFYREESDFFISALRAGYKVVATSRAFTYLRDRSSGGIEHNAKLTYEYWVLRNNWLFLSKHGAWLRRNGQIRGKAHHQFTVVRQRSKPLLRAAVRRLKPAAAR
ncbi:glycosyltransferase family 2 protein [Paractinoplanes maris]|uniref:glycosyltransferase family 2 protein n=1 Tax=Paractinoplanes maris TaxID=1734446 RepID=UPI0020206DEF|nr:glycosyltransferase [Actinoplanes maris]